jgi:Caspase domain
VLKLFHSLLRNGKAMFRYLIAAALVAVCASVLMAAMALAQKEPPRLALLIGNQNYAAKVGALKNPRQDVALIEASLKRLGFKVTILNDADYRSMDIAVKRYADELRRAGPGALGFFYYSGHGAANADTQINYLIPVDVASAEDNTVWYQSFQQNQIIDLLSKQASNATQFVVFDACRNELNLSAGTAKAIGADKGFVPVGNAAGMLIAYATAPNRTASDAGEGGGAYAKTLAEELLRPGVEAVTMFRNVQIRVKQTIGQDPWLSFPSLSPVYLAGLNAASSEGSNTPQKVPIAEDAQAWSLVQNTSSEAVLNEFVRRFPASVYASFAKARIYELNQARVALENERRNQAEQTKRDQQALNSLATSPPRTTSKLSIFNGNWTAAWMPGQNCGAAWRSVNKYVITNGNIEDVAKSPSYTTSGSVSESGALRFTYRYTDTTPTELTASLSGDEGSGIFRHDYGSYVCEGTISWKRGR